MNRTKWAIFIAMASGTFAATAYAETKQSPFTPSAYEYGNYDYYSQISAPAAQAPPAPTTPAPAPAPAPAASAPACGCESSCNAAPSCGCNSSCGCGCNTCCDCNGCCHEKLGHLCCCCPKLHPCFCWCDSCPLTCEDQKVCRCFDDCCCLKEHCATLTGWVSGGIMGNSDSPRDHFNGPVTFADRDDGQLNQSWFALERTNADLSKNCGWWLGGRVDFMWGSDYFFTTAAGLDGTPVGNVPRWGTARNSQGQDTFLYGFAMPQLYAETDYDDLKIKWGHFFTIIGYEVVPDIGNFFYTHAYTFQYGEPFTHTGVLASRQWCDNWTWYAGLVSGWNEFDLTEGPQFLGGVSYTDKDYGSLAFSIITGDESTANVAAVAPFRNRTMYSLVWSRTLTSRWSYVLQHDLGVQADAQTALGTRQGNWYGVNQYLFYKMNCCWTAGLRFEWFRDEEGFVVTGLRPGNPDVGQFFPGNFYETSLGFNYKPNGNWNIRPELRYDWFDGQGQPYDGTSSKRQFLFGLDAIYQF
jgi:hypothetical protein